MEPVIQHWLATVARAAGLEGADTLEVSSDVDPSAAWETVGLVTGVEMDELARVVARHFRLGVADLDTIDAHVQRLLPGRVARKLGVVPLRYSDRHLWVATADPVSLEAEKEITHVSGRNTHFEVAPPAALADALERVYPDRDEPHELPPLEVAARGGPRILVVDDDPGTRLLLRTFLESAGFRVAEAADGTEALEKLEAHGDPYALVTLDLDMPELPGLDVLRRIRVAWPRPSCRWWWPPAWTTPTSR